MYLTAAQAAIDGGATHIEIFGSIYGDNTIVLMMCEMPLKAVHKKNSWSQLCIRVVARSDVTLKEDQFPVTQGSSSIGT